MKKRAILLLPLRSALWVVLLMASVAGGAILLLNWVQPREPIRAALEDALARFLERPVSIDSVQWGFAPPGIVGYDVRVYESDGREMAVSPKVRMSLAMRAFLRRKTLDVEAVTFLSPRFVVRRRSDGDSDLARMIRQVHGRLREGRAIGQGSWPVAFHHFAVRNGRVFLADDRIQVKPLPVSLYVDADGDLEGVSGERSFPFLVNGRAEGGGVSGPFSLSGRLGKGDGVSVASPGLPLALLADKAPWLKSWTGSVVFKGRWDVGEGNASLTGRLVDARPAAGPRDLSLEGDFRFLRRSTSTASLALTDKGTDARLEITVAPWAERKAWIVFVSSSADVDRLMRAWEALRPAEEAAESPPVAVASGTAPLLSPEDSDLWRIEARADVRDADFRGESLRHLSFSAIRKKQGGLAIKDLRAEAFGGTLSAEASFFHRPKEKPRAYTMPPRFRLSWRLDGLDVARFSETFKIKKVFSGTGSSQGTLEGAWPIEDWTRMDGDVSFEVKDGVVWGLPGMVSAFSHLNLTSLFTKKDESGGMAFSHAIGRFEMVGGRLRFEQPARFENRTLQMSLAGDVDVAKQTVDAALVFHFLTFMGEVLRAVPGIGTALMGGKKSLFPVVVRMTGPLSDPKIDYQAARSLLAPFWTPFRKPEAPAPRPAADGGN